MKNINQLLFYILIMLSPKRTKYRKPHVGNMRGKATRGTQLVFGEFGLQALEPCWIT